MNSAVQCTLHDSYIATETQARADRHDQASSKTQQIAFCCIFWVGQQ